MARGTVKRRAADIVQASPLLSLPPELRNNIYEFVASDSTSIAIRQGHVNYASPMKAVCRQMRAEYEGIHRVEAPKYAQHVIIIIDNFVHKDVMPVIHKLPALASGEERTFKLRIHLTNTFDNYLNHLRTLDWGIETGDKDADGNEVRLACEYSVSFDHRTFDVDYARPVVERLRWSLGKANLDWRKRWEWQKIERAIVQAFERYDSALRLRKGGKNVRKWKAEDAVEGKAAGKHIRGNKVR